MVDEASVPPEKRILIVEDNELNLRLLNDILEAHGYAILKTAHGVEAIELAQASHPDLILLDIQLPDISGLEVSSRLKADETTRGIPIIGVSAFAMAGDERRARDHGCDAYVTKPVILRDLLVLIDQLARGHGTAG